MQAGIASMIRSDDGGGMYPAISGAELLVRTEDVQKANEALNGLDPSHLTHHNNDLPAVLY